MLSARRIHDIDQRRQRRRLVNIKTELTIKEHALGVTLFAVATVLQTRGVDQIVHRSHLATTFKLHFPQIVFPKHEATLYKRRFWSFFRSNTQHPTRSIAIQSRSRTTHHFNAFGRAQIQTIHLALAIGQSGRNAIDQHLNAPNAERGSGAETSDR